MSETITIDFLLGLESQVWDALKNGDIAQDSLLLSDGFLGVYETGYSGKDEHVNQLKNGPTVFNYKIFNPRVIIISPDTALLTYEAVWQRINNYTIGEKETYFITSIWRVKNGIWKNIFSQDTKSIRYEMYND